MHSHGCLWLHLAQVQYNFLYQLNFLRASSVLLLWIMPEALLTLGSVGQVQEFLEGTKRGSGVAHYCVFSCSDLLNCSKRLSEIMVSICSLMAAEKFPLAVRPPHRLEAQQGRWKNSLTEEQRTWEVVRGFSWGRGGHGPGRGVEVWECLECPSFGSCVWVNWGLWLFWGESSNGLGIFSLQVNVGPSTFLRFPLLTLVALKGLYICYKLTKLLHFKSVPPPLVGRGGWYKMVSQGGFNLVTNESEHLLMGLLCFIFCEMPVAVHYFIFSWIVVFLDF